VLDKCIAYAKAHRHPELTEADDLGVPTGVVVLLGSRLAAVQNNAFTGGTTGNATPAVLELRTTRARKSDHGWRTVSGRHLDHRDVGMVDTREK